jgi:hypothetical protein
VTGYQANKDTRRKGVLSQRKLVTLLRPLIDAAGSRAPTHTRDEARRTLRELLATSNWQTPYVFHNIAARRCRYLTTMGYIVPKEYLMDFETDARIKRWHNQHDR